MTEAHAIENGNRPETKAEAYKARESQFERISNTVLGGVGFLANKPARYLLTLMVVLTFVMGGYSMYWLNNQNIEGRRETAELRREMSEMQAAHSKEIADLRKEHYEFLAKDHFATLSALEANTKKTEEVARVLFRIEATLDKLQKN